MPDNEFMMLAAGNWLLAISFAVDFSQRIENKENDSGFSPNSFG